MTITARVAGLATLALAALPVAALTTAAHAQTAVPHERVYIGDLKLGSASDRAIFAYRVDHVARKFCANEKNLDLKAACQSGVRIEANERAASNVQFASRN
ncbi:MAG: UrcA family protein [Caulobacterales bacterium]|jgi:UrcA family protein